MLFAVVPNGALYNVCVRGGGWYYFSWYLIEIIFKKLYIYADEPPDKFGWTNNCTEVGSSISSESNVGLFCEQIQFKLLVLLIVLQLYGD